MSASADATAAPTGDAPPISACTTLRADALDLLYPFAVLAQGAYGGSEAGDDLLGYSGWEREYLYVDPHSGLRASLFVDRQQGQAAVAFAATDGSGLEEWLTALPQEGARELPSQYVEAALVGGVALGLAAGVPVDAGVDEMLLEINPDFDGVRLSDAIESIRGYDLYLTGHSLGGGLASFVAHLFGAVAVTFDGALLHPSEFQSDLVAYQAVAERYFAGLVKHSPTIVYNIVSRDSPSGGFDFVATSPGALSGSLCYVDVPEAATQAGGGDVGSDADPLWWDPSTISYAVSDGVLWGADGRHSLGDLVVAIGTERIEVRGPSSVEEEETAQYSVFAYLRDGVEQPVRPVWSVDEGCGSITEEGLLSLSAACDSEVVDVTAEYGMFSDRFPVTVIRDPAYPVSLGIDGPNWLREGESGSFHAFALMSDGRHKPISPTWSIVPPRRADVDAAGVVTAANVTGHQMAKVIIDHGGMSAERIIQIYDSGPSAGSVPASTGPLAIALQRVDASGAISVGDPVSFSLSVSGGARPYRYRWWFGIGSPNGGVTADGQRYSTQADPGSITFSRAGRYDVSVRVIDADDTELFDNVQVVVESSADDGSSGDSLADSGGDPTGEPLDSSTDDGLGMTFVTLPAGSLMMGSAESEPGHDPSEGPQHSVSIPSFRIMTTEVTQGQWEAVMGNAPSLFTACGDDCPVENVSWEDVQEFIVELNRLTGGSYRLPTEAEWEYAARAGTTTAYWWGDDAEPERANCRDASCDDAFYAAAPVASFDANPWGLYDTAGNVREWVQDCWNDDYSGAPSDGSAWESDDCGQRVMRGGSWSDDQEALLRSASRVEAFARDQQHPAGFRLARD
ncbi:SUMF1/EgtB/PvdO family nonheme iron enzyme [Endothiovibrio diazotrophicus]